MNWLTCVANSENEIAHIDSVLKNIQQVSEEMDYLRWLIYDIKMIKSL